MIRHVHPQKFVFSSMSLCFYVFQVSERPFVERHIENPSTFPTNSSHAEAFSSHNVTCTSHNEVYASNSPGNAIRELAGREEDKENSLYVSIYQTIIKIKQKLVRDVS